MLECADGWTLEIERERKKNRVGDRKIIEIGKKNSEGK